MTARDLIKGSLRLLGVLASGEEPTAAEAQDALASLNSLLSSWRTDRLMVYAIEPQTFPLVPGQMTYTLGPGGNWNTVRPNRVEKVQLQYTQSGTPYPLNLPLEMLDIDQYNQLIVPTTQSPIPTSVYIDDAFPTRNVSFYTVPSEAQQVQIFTWQQLSAFASLQAVVELPDGYERALRFGLAVEIAPEFGTEASETVVSLAVSSKAEVKAANNTYTPLLQADPALISYRTGFNYLTGN